MMLSRTGWGETSLPVAFQTVGGRRAPWGCAAGAPYRGTASPPPPPLMCVCVCVCVCVGMVQLAWYRVGVQIALRAFFCLTITG